MSEMILAGIELMFIGMATVFVFLTLLVLLVSAVAKIIQRLSPPSAQEDIDANVVAAISASVHKYRQKHSQ